MSTLVAQRVRSESAPRLKRRQVKVVSVEGTCMKDRSNLTGRAQPVVGAQPMATRRARFTKEEMFRSTSCERTLEKPATRSLQQA